MQRFFIEVAYKGTNYSGFQIQFNAETIQSKIVLALETLYKQPFELTCSSRTDAGVHAYQNFFHVDTLVDITDKIYNINAILPKDIVVKSIRQVPLTTHARFSASSREYKYCISRSKDVFAIETAWFYPYTLDIHLLNKAAAIVFEQKDFQSFSKKHTQVQTYLCTISKSIWLEENGLLVYHVEGNRFLRGMVRALVSTMLMVGKGQLSLTDFEQIFVAKDCSKANFAAPPNGLFLVAVNYPKAY